MNILLSAVFSIAILIFSTSSLAQYTYIEAGINNTNINYANTGHSGGRTDYRNICFRLNIVTRLIRNFGIGAELNVPFFEKNSYSFHDAHEPDGSYFWGFDYNERYTPQKMDYTFQNAASGAIFGRFYLSTIINPYIDVKLSFSKITEEFTFQRAYLPAIYDYYDSEDEIPAVNINKVVVHKMVVPSIAFGLQPHIGKHAFINFNFGLDIYNFGKNSGFTYDLTHSWDIIDDKHNIVRIESKAKNQRSGIFFNLGAGYYF